jgi:signal transduction histidine kinase
VDAPAGALVGSWDRSQLEQVITNLVGNAIKYGAGKPVVIRAAAPSDTQVLVDVIDRGIGVRPEDRERIFDRFERAAEGYGGLGLGLSIAKSIVERHGGRIAVVDGAPGAGATFRVSLPRG